MALALRVRAVLLAPLVAALLLLATTARADRPAGVTAQTLKPPSGPGSLKGLGESFSPNIGTGTGSYSVGIDVPPGFLAPSISLGYNDGGGKGVLGLGWSLPVLQIYRSLDKGAPRFDEDDRFAVRGPGFNDELVRVNERLGYYRLKNEGGFALFVRNAADDSWTIRLPNGQTAHLGLTGAARQTSRGRTYGWFLERQEDRFGHWLEQSYFRHEGSLYLEEIAYQLHADPAYQNTIVFSYESRPDVFTDYSHGEAATTALRLARVDALHGARLVRSYSLSYRSGLLTSLLERIEMQGENGLKLPPVTFDYLRYADEAGELVTMQNVPPLEGLLDGESELDDVNGDALPDLMVARANHYLYYENFDGRKWLPARTLANSPDRGLSEPGVAFADIDGDGFRDLVHSQGAAFRYYPGGDIQAGVFKGFRKAVELGSDASGFDFTSSAVKMTDLDSDGRIDLLWQKPGQDTSLLNRRDQLRESTVAELPPDVDFDDPRLSLTDFNGDGVLDFVFKDMGYETSRLRVWFGLGHGEYLAERLVGALPRGDSEEFQLQDLNNDGQVDLLRISGTHATYYLNRGDLSFTGARGDFAGLPASSATQKLLFADMNGNGTRDVVWITTDFKLRYLELFGQSSPALLSRIDNGMGLVTELAYRPSTDYAIEAKKRGKRWAHPLTSAVPVLAEVRTSDSLDVLGFAATETRSSYEYRDGYYDTKEREFRGFETAIVTDWGDNQHATLVTETRMHVGRDRITGADQEVLKGKPYLQLQRTEAGELLGAVESRWETKLLCQEDQPANFEQILPDCSALGVSGALGQAPRQEDKDDLVAMGLSTAALTARYERTQQPRFTWTKMSYDAWGRVTEEATFGEALYDGTYVPDGDLRSKESKLDGAYGGDEQVKRSTFLDDPSQWLIGLPVQTELRDAQGTLYDRSRTYYDDLPFGAAARGLVTLTTRYDADEGRYIDVEKTEYDDDGNKVATVNAVGDRMELIYDPLVRQFPVQERVQIGSGTAEEDFVTFSAKYDLAYGAIVETTDPNRQTSRFVLDGLGRLAEMYDPLSTLPVSKFAYTFGTSAHPLSTTRIDQLQEAGGRYQTTFSYSDGTGRARQQKVQAEAALGWVASGWTTFSSRGKPVIVYDTFSSSSSEFEAPPGATPRTRTHLDALGRPIQVDLPATDRLTQGGKVITQYLPFETRTYTEAESSSGELGNPEVTRVDGLGRVREVEKYNDTDEGTKRLRFRLGYDTRGSITSFANPSWNGNPNDTRHLRRYEYDSLGRLRVVRDPNAGTIRYGFDDVGRMVQRQDALNQTQLWSYGKAGRLLSHKTSQPGAPDYEYRYHYDEPAPSSPLSNQAASAAHLRGKLAWLEYPTGEEHYAFDARGRMTEEATRLWNPAVSSFENQVRDTFTRKLEYRADGKVTKATAPGGLVLESSYTVRGALSSLSAKLGNVARPITSEVVYDQRGDEIGAKGGNGVRTCSRFDQRGQLTHFSAVAPGETCSPSASNSGVHHLEYLRGPDGLVDGIVDLSSSSTGLPRLDAQYAYDTVHQLVGVSDARGETSYQYDEIQNLVRRDVERGVPEGPVGAFGYGEDGAGPNAITRAGGETYSYDAAGQMQRYNGYDLRFDGEGRLVRATNATKGISLVQHYDDAGERRIALVYRPGQPVKVHRFVAPDYEQRDGEEIWFAGGGSISAEIVKSKGIKVDAYLLDQLTEYVSDAGGTPKPLPEEYMDLNGDGRRLDSDDLALAQQGFQSQQRVGGERTLFKYSTTDHLGSTTHSSDSVGEIVSHQRFHPYGGIAERSGDRSYKTYLGTDIEPEEDLGLQRIGLRYYAPKLGRWVTPDPLFVEDPQQLVTSPLESALYSYSGNNPIMSKDPSGLEGEAADLGDDWLINDDIVAASEKRWEAKGLDTLAAEAERDPVQLVKWNPDYFAEGRWGAREFSDDFYRGVKALSEATHVRPEAYFQVWSAESNMDPNSHRGTNQALGLFQFFKSGLQSVVPAGSLDESIEKFWKEHGSPEAQLKLGQTYINRARREAGVTGVIESGAELHLLVFTPAKARAFFSSRKAAQASEDATLVEGPRPICASPICAPGLPKDGSTRDKAIYKQNGMDKDKDSKISYSELAGLSASQGVSSYMRRYQEVNGP